MKVSAEVQGKTGNIDASPDKWVKAASDALLSAVKEAASSIQAKGRADIGQAGNFGSRWIEGFEAKVTGGEGEVQLDVTEAVGLWPVFQFGAHIQGKPLLFFKPNKPLADGSTPLLISKHSVNIPKKFHLIEISQTEAQAVPLLFAQKLKEAKSSLSGKG